MSTLDSTPNRLEVPRFQIAYQSFAPLGKDPHIDARWIWKNSLGKYCLTIVREDLNRTAPRVMAVLRPLKVVIENLPEAGGDAHEAGIHADVFWTLAE